MFLNVDNQVHCRFIFSKQHIHYGHTSTCTCIIAATTSGCKHMGTNNYLLRREILSSIKFRLNASEYALTIINALADVLLKHHLKVDLPIVQGQCIALYKLMYLINRFVLKRIRII